MTCYRIYTKKENPYKIEKLTRQYFTGATIYTGRGIYEDNAEFSCIIEVIGDPEEKLATGYWAGFRLDIRVVRFADKIKKLNNQESVFMTYHEVNTVTV